MNTQANNVVGLDNGSIYQDIKTFLNKHESNSKETKVKYERSIRSFFMYFCNKKIENLKVEDLAFRNADILRYQLYLKEKYENATVNSSIAAIVSLYDFLETNEYPVKSKVMRVDNLPEDSESYGELNLDEAEMMSNLVLKQVKGYEKSCIIKLAYRTSFRKSSLLNLNWTDIKADPRSNTFLVTVIGKGNKKHTRSISEKMYNELLKIKELPYYNRYSDGKIFHLSKTTLQQMMKTLNEEMGFTEDRWITFHSTRNVAPNLIMETSDNIVEAQEQLGHSNMDTFYKKYMSKKRNYGGMASVRIDEEIDDTVFDELTHEQLLEMVKGMKNGIGYALREEASRILNK